MAITVYDPLEGMLLDTEAPVAEVVRELLRGWWEEQSAYCLVVYDGKVPVVTLLGGEPEEFDDRVTGSVQVCWAGCGTDGVELYQVTYWLRDGAYDRATVDEVAA